MRVLVVGLGTAGRRHARHAHALGHDVAALRRKQSGGEELETFTDSAAAEAWQPDAVVVATPTALHSEGARWAIERRLPFLVEKPLTNTAVSARTLANEASQAGVTGGVAYNLRHHPALRAIAAVVGGADLGRLLYGRVEVGQYLPDWHPHEDYRVGYAARAELGGGALLTLSHELDCLRWIGGEIASCAGIRSRVSGLEIDVDDVAELVCRHDSGSVGSVHVDFLDRAYNRRSRWVCEEGSVEWRWGGPVVLERGEAREAIWRDDGYDLDDTYARQLESFLAGTPAASLDDGARVVELAEGIVDAC